MASPVPAEQDCLWTDSALSYDALIPELGCYRRQLAKVLRDTEALDSVIDAGCGTGLVSQPLAARGLAVFSFDNNLAMLERARIRRQRSPEAVRARWRVMEGTLPRFPRSMPVGVDAVVMNNVLAFLPDAELALREAHAHLRSGGLLIVAGNKRPCPDLQRVLSLSIEEWKAEGRWGPALQNALGAHLSHASRIASDGGGMVTFYEPEALVEVLRRVGFRHVRAADGDDYFGENFYVCMVK